jgi:ABC-type transporter lipoprotein component MlaA
MRVSFRSLAPIVLCRLDRSLRSGGKNAAAAASDDEEDMALPGIGEPAGATNATTAAISDPIEPVNRAFYHFTTNCTSGS